MLPVFHQQRYWEFKQVLERVRESADAAADGATLTSEVSDLQHFFEHQILSLDASELLPVIEQRVQAYQVEINKQLRLLGMDVMFLQAARQADTRAQRWRQVSDRLSVLIRYCDGLLGKPEGPA